jgi:copper(I)-binding protein
MKHMVRLIVGAALLLAACAPAATGGLSVSDAWARTSTMMERAGAAYMVIHNSGSEADRLLGASTDAAATVELHESSEADGMMQMAPVAAIDVPAGGQAELAPGGFHVMLIDLTRALNAGDTLTLTLTFEKAGTMEVTAEVREE